MIASFRRRFPAQIEELLVDILWLAGEMGLLELKAIGLGGRTIRGAPS